MAYFGNRGAVKLEQRNKIYKNTPVVRRTGNLLGIAVRYGLDGPGIESRWRRVFSATVQTAVWPKQSSVPMGTASPSPGLKRQGRGIDHPHSSSTGVRDKVELYLYSSCS